MTEDDLSRWERRYQKVFNHYGPSSDGEAADEIGLALIAEVRRLRESRQKRD